MTAFRSDDEPLSLLGLKVGSTFPSRAEVESSFRKRSLRCHPDRHPKDALAKTRFLRISRAKEHLLAKAGKPATSSAPVFSRNSGAGTAPRTQHQKRAAEDERKRQEAQERLRQREAAAELKRRRKRQAESEAGSRRAAALAQEKRREELAAQQRRREELFEAWRKRKHSAANASPDAKSSNVTAPQQHKRSQTSHPNEKPHKCSKESSWEPAERNAFQPSCSRPRRRAPPGGSLEDSRHQKALLRLQQQRDSGELPSIFRSPEGSWWKADKEVDSYLRREELYGAV